ncbi:2-phosphosulfolactate phosphatase [Bacillus sp. FJAT-27225]|uniref:2-phosphosulfolactate phosphatase n=1 Tax=Bacillus sp. FJAT-27225 TaxID=1743144 RepID=UPI00080C3082|nr:2-phosphosulfolactate phosphatase [Bacillus sp. FJAT-27225]OCA88135.1 2-phosphosulfolactate phosphatase [Bacillus sp. FJAT-27225]
MKVNIFQGHSPDLPHSTANIVIDVIRAFTVAHYAFERGAKEILLVGTTDEAFRLKRTNPDYLLAGEIGGLPIEGFDFDNSPKKMSEANVAGKTLVQKTTNGVRATLNALDAEAVFVTGYSNAKKTAQVVRELCGPDSIVNIIASHPEGDDDLACAEYIKAILLGDESARSEVVVERIKGCKQAEKFFEPAMREFDEEDISFCVKELASDFVMYVDCTRGLPRIVRVNEHELHRVGAAGSGNETEKQRVNDFN